MVGPITDEERRAGGRWIAVTFVLVIVFSTGMIALHVDATLGETLAVMAVGTGIGVGLYWYMLRIVSLT